MAIGDPALHPSTDRTGLRGPGAALLAAGLLLAALACTEGLRRPVPASDLTAPSLTAPASVTVQQPGYLASVPVQGSATYSWQMDRGRILDGQGTPQIRFTATETGPVHLACTVSDATGSVQSMKTIQAIPGPILSVPTVSVLHQGADAASTQARAGVSYLWTVTGGQILSGQGTSEIRFSNAAPVAVSGSNRLGTAAATPAGEVTVTLEERDEQTGATSSTSVAIEEREEDSTPPAGLEYQPNPAVFIRGVAIAEVLQSSTGGSVQSFTVAPALPSGLSLDRTTGFITGTPDTVAETAAYVITATSAVGSTTASLTLTVKEQAPDGLSYSLNPAVYTQFAAIPDNRPSLAGGGPATAFSVAPALPDGLVLDGASGIIRGTPTIAADPVGYTVTASNAGGKTQATLTLSVQAASRKLPAPPSNLSYRTNPASYTKGTSITDNTPSSSGGPVDSFSISPALPAGLSFDTSTGVISGTPSAVSPQTDYLVTATNSGSSTSATLTLTVNDVPPANLTYSTNPATYTNGTAIPSSNTPASTGGAVVSYTISPALPAGLSFSTTTGAITGTPSVLGTGTYTVTATNSGGNTSVGVVITVNDVPPGSLGYTYTSATFTKGVAIAPDPPFSTTGGAITSYALLGGLPAGLSLDTSTGIITGTPTAISSSASYSVRASNSGGHIDIVLTFTVNDAAPTNLTYSTNPAVYSLQVAISTNSPTHGGGAVTGYSISPGLPAGLSFDTTTGAITGTPLVTSAQANYTVTASNTGGNTTATVSIKVSNPPVGLSYVHNVLSYSVGDSIGLNFANLTVGATGLTFTVNPSLPAGLTLDVNFGTLAGTATAVAATANYTVTASNADGSSSTQVTITIAPGPDATLLLPLAVHPGDTWMQASVPVQTGRNYTWTAPNFTGQGTGAIHFSAGFAVGTFNVGVTVSNPSNGRQVSNNATVSVQTGTWLVKSGASSTTHDSGTATRLANGRVLLVGGNTSRTGPVATTELYDPATDTILAIGSLGEARAEHTATLLADGRVLVAGGSSNLTDATSSAEIYDPATGLWSPTGAMVQPRVEHAAVLLADGRVLVAGGYGHNGVALDSAEIYDPAQGTWSVTHDAGLNQTRLATARIHPAMALLPDGTALAVGGQDSDGTPLASTDRFSPAAGTWAAGPTLHSGRTNFAMVQFANGSLLVCGGVDSSFTGVASAELLTANTWTQAAAMTADRYDHSATVLTDGRVLVAGGTVSGSNTDSSEIYNPTTDSWAVTTDGLQPTHLTDARSRHSTALLADGKVLVAGGEGSSPLSSTEVFAPATGVWTPTTGSTGKGAIGQCTVLLPATGKVLAVGGLAEAGGPNPYAQLYEPSTHAWTLASSPNAARAQAAATLLGDGSPASDQRVLLVGGEDSTGTLASAEIYDLSLDSWTPTATSMATPRYLHSATRLQDGTVLVVGGLDATANVTASVEIYDPHLQLWSPGTSLQFARAGHTATLLADGSVLVTGGMDSAGNPIATSERYLPGSHTWTFTNMVTGRAYHTATLLQDGRVLAAGGYDANFATLAASELYDPATDTWSPTVDAGSQITDMGHPRENHTAIPLPTGLVLVAGGDNTGSMLDNAECFDPATGLWTDTGYLNMARSSHLGILLGDGTAMIGFGIEAGQITEIYHY